jgi:hypothetical protein
MTNYDRRITKDGLIFTSSRLSYVRLLFNHSQRLVPDDGNSSFVIRNSSFVIHRTSSQTMIISKNKNPPGFHQRDLDHFSVAKSSGPILACCPSTVVIPFRPVGVEAPFCFPSRIVEAQQIQCCKCKHRDMVF